MSHSAQTLPVIGKRETATQYGHGISLLRLYAVTALNQLGNFIGGEYSSNGLKSLLNQLVGHWAGPDQIP